MDIVEQLRASLPSFQQVGNGLAALLPRLFVAGLVLLIGWLLAKLLRATTRAVVTRVGRALFSRRLPLEARTAFLEGQGADLLGTAVFWVVLFVAAMFATETLGLPVVTTWLASVTAYLPRILLGLAIVVASVVAARMVQALANRTAESLGARSAERVGRLARGALLALGLLVALQQIGIDVSFVTTGLYIVLGGAVLGAALAFGLGSQTVIANIMAMHYVRRMFRAGDGVQLGSIRGKLLRTTAVAVVLETEEGEVTLPARELLTSAAHRYPAEADK